MGAPPHVGILRCRAGDNNTVIAPDFLPRATPMNRHVNAIAGRLSLRPPQREALEILDRITEIVPPRKGTDIAAALTAIQSAYPQITDFEHEFPSLCGIRNFARDPQTLPGAAAVAAPEVQAARVRYAELRLTPAHLAIESVATASRSPTTCRCKGSWAHTSSGSQLRRRRLTGSSGRCALV